MTRIELLNKLIDDHGRGHKLPKVYAELFTVGELLDLCQAQEAAKKHFDPRSKRERDFDQWQAETYETRQSDRPI